MNALFLLILLTVPTDGSRAEFARIAEAHRRLERYHVDIDVVFATGSTLPPLSASVRRLSTDRELRTFGDLTILQTRVWRIAVDTGDRVIVVGRRGVEEPVVASAAASPGEALDAWLAGGARVTGGAVSADGQGWTLASPGESGPSAEFVVDPRTSLVKRLAYNVRDQSGKSVRVEIRYTWRDASRIKRGEFDEKRFINVDGNDVRPAQAYAGYRVLRSDASR